MIDILNSVVVLANYVIIPAITYGSQLALGALGVTLVYGILRFSNFAHGDTMAFGAMVTILFTWLFQSWGITFGPLPTALLAIPLGILATTGLLLATDKLVYQSYRRQKVAPVILVIVSMGVMFILNGLVRIIIGPNEQRFSDGERFIPIFAAAIVGGLGNPIGAIAGGFVIAFSEVLITYPLKRVLKYLVPDNMEPSGLVQLLSTDYKFAVSFTILLIVLLFRPTGLFRGKSV